MIDSLKRHSILKDKIICVKTRKSKTAIEVINNGADMIYEDSGCAGDSNLAKIIASENIPLIFSYNKGTSNNNAVRKLEAIQGKTGFVSGLRKRIDLLSNYHVNK